MTRAAKPATIADIASDQNNPVSSPLSSGARILLVEDNLLNQQLMLDLLRGHQLQVEVADNGRDAVNAVERQSYDVVLMDIQMPEMDGLEATRRIRSRAEFSKLPIIAMTANVMAEDRARCADAGMNDFLGKPIDMAEVVTVLARWIKPSAATSAKASVIDPTPTPVIDWDLTLRRLSGRADLLKRALKDFSTRAPSYADEILQLQAQGKWLDAQHHAHTLKGIAANLGMNRLMEAANYAERTLRSNQPLEADLQNELRSASVEAITAAAKHATA